MPVVVDQDTETLATQLERGREAAVTSADDGDLDAIWKCRHGRR